MAHVENHLSIEDLAARYRACEDVCAARHYQTIWLLAQGHKGSQKHEPSLSENLIRREFVS